MLMIKKANKPLEAQAAEQ